MSLNNSTYTQSLGIPFTQYVTSSAGHALISSSTYFNDTSDNLPRYKDADGNVLVPFVSSSYAVTASYALNGGGGSDTNFANTDLTFTGFRTHDTNGNGFIIASDGAGTSGPYMGMTLQDLGMGSTVSSSYIGVSATNITTFNSSIQVSVENTSSITISPSQLNINSANKDHNVVIEGVTDTSLLVTDASTDRVGIGKNTPNAKLDVNGDTLISGSLTVTGTLDADSGSFNYIEADALIKHTGDNGTGITFTSDTVVMLGNTFQNAVFSTSNNTIGNSFLEQPLTVHGDSTFEDRIITTTTDNAITTAGTFNPTGGNRSYVTLSGSIAVTLADGVQGQLLHIYCRDITAAGTTTITPTNAVGFTSVAFDAIGETATLMFADGGGGQWYLISSFGATVS